MTDVPDAWEVATTDSDYRLWEYLRDGWEPFAVTSSHRGFIHHLRRSIATESGAPVIDAKPLDDNWC